MLSNDEFLKKIENGEELSEEELETVSGGYFIGSHYFLTSRIVDNMRMYVVIDLDNNVTIDSGYFLWELVQRYYYA